MISLLEVHGFKRFEHQGFKLAPLTVLAGLNGVGKTSLVHALLLLREASQRQSTGFVQLNGPYGLDLGTAEDVINWNSTDLVLTGIDSFGSSKFEFGSTSGQEMFLQLRNTPSHLCTAFSSEPGAFTYLSAERLGPRTSVPAASMPIDRLEVGVWGENCAHILEARGSKPADENRLHPQTTAPSLLKYQVERWMSEIVRPIEIDAERYQGSTVCALRFRSPDGNYVRATNMGFGVSYALPVILAGLIAREDGLLIVENPEAHLHPQGQSRMGWFLAWLASKKVQVVVETHSDHVINGIRRAIGESSVLAEDKAVVHYFPSAEEAPPQELHFNKHGGMNDWPPGFFDQYAVDTAALGQIRRRIRQDGIRN